ncbi:MAG: cytochrome-c oxidase, cbb3-type subunit III [Gammaproteobacteria bacterium]|nr:cytochrome-c oxidase, cbb3-type subunit III [Gammaproteobacteria bacterium]
MDGFNDSLWYILIFIATVGGMLALFLVTQRLSTKPRSDDEGEHVWDEDLTELHNPLPRWWVALFYLTIAFSFLYLLLYPGLRTSGLFLNWSSVQQYEEEVKAHEERFGALYNRYAQTPIEALVHDRQALQIGERLYATYCATCHGSDARGAKGFPNLADADWLYGGEPEAIKASIRDGRKGLMPGWREALGSDTAVADVVQYTLSLSGPAQAPERVARGGERYQQLCVACHGKAGRGNPQLGAPNLTDDIWLYGGDTRTVTQSIAGGRAGVMPAHANLLGDARIHLLTAFVYALSRTE